MLLLGEIVILQGVGHPISCLGVCYANDPQKGGYMTLAPALDLTTSLRGDLPSTHLGQTPEMTPGRMVYNGKCATDQAQRRGVKPSAGPYTGLFYLHLLATELGMRVESVLNIDAPQFALHSRGPNTRDDPSRHGVQSKVCNRSGPTPRGETECWPIHRPIPSTS